MSTVAPVWNTEESESWAVLSSGNANGVLASGTGASVGSCFRGSAAFAVVARMAVSNPTVARPPVKAAYIAGTTGPVAGEDGAASWQMPPR